MLSLSKHVQWPLPAGSTELTMTTPFCPSELVLDNRQRPTIAITLPYNPTPLSLLLIQSL